jgi:hypothetical protein
MKKSGVSVENSMLYIANIISKVFPWSYPFILERVTYKEGLYLRFINVFFEQQHKANIL